MYYLRTKSAVDAIKFTLDNSKKEKSTPIAEAITTTVSQTAAASAIAPQPAVPVEPLTPQELKQMLAKAKEGEDDDCLMCGS